MLIKCFFAVAKAEVKLHHTFCFVFKLNLLFSVKLVLWLWLWLCHTLKSVTNFLSSHNMCMHSGILRVQFALSCTVLILRWVLLGSEMTDNANMCTHQKTKTLSYNCSGGLFYYTSTREVKWFCGPRYEASINKCSCTKSCIFLDIHFVLQLERLNG